MTSANKITKCRCGSNLNRYELVDARAIFIAYVCDKCVDDMKSKFRFNIFNDPNYECDESIEESD